MQRLIQGLAIAAVVVLVLLLTGIIDEDYILLYLTLFGAPGDATAESFDKALDALARADWRALGAVSSSLLKTGLLVYFIRSVAYVVLALLILRWSLPYLKRAYASLRTTSPLIADSVLSGTDVELRQSVAGVLRVRASRKRTESYAFLSAALVCLVIAVGFVTRDYHRERPDALEFGATSTFDALLKSEAVLRDSRFEEGVRRQDQDLHERDLIELVRTEITAGTDARNAEIVKSNHALLTALVNRAGTRVSAQQSGEASVAREYIQFARAQLDVASRQAELEVIQTTAIAIAIKLAALALVLALAGALVHLYDRGLHLSVQYDGIADSLLLAPRQLPLDLEQLRRILTPADAPTKGVRVPRSVLKAVEELLKEAKNKMASKGSTGEG